MYAGVALYKGRDAKSGLEVEVLSGSVQVGAQNELQIGFQRAGGAQGALAGSVETFTARANLGIYNDDGSKGLNVGVSATAVGFEATVGGPNSVSYGVSAGVGLGGSVGLRDVDGDGKKELCFRASFLAASVGACGESPL
ncbi:MAG: hypothetical protein K0R38_7212 [Polyangiaceae bacterium]|nr:hypothetical protein [Polyangiaceae bacterium]